MPTEIRDLINEALLSDGLYEVAFPNVFVHSLAMYAQAPGSWLLGPAMESDISIDWEIAQDHLGQVVSLSAHGQSQTATDAKYMLMRAYHRAGKVSYASHLEDMVDRLVRYPNGLSDEELRKARPMIRANFNGLFGRSDDESTPPRVDWAKTFWRKNWQIYPCMPLRRMLGSNMVQSTDIGEHQDARNTIAELFSRFLRASRWADPDLYKPDRYEVLTGVVVRGFRLTNALINSSALKSPEIGTGMIRILVDSEITLTWLLKYDRLEDYEQFKKFGKGKLKLLLLNLEEYESNQKEVDPGLAAAINDIRSEVNQDEWEEFLEVDLGSNFNKMTTYQMAKQVNMEDVYRLQFSPASGAVHGEWSHLDRYALTRCGNPLHRWHRIPTDDLQLLESPGVAGTALSIMYSMLEKYENGIAK